MKNKIYDDIDENLLKLSDEVEIEIKSIFKEIDDICEINSVKVMKAFQECI